jgi:hypothetical protein
MIPKRKIMSFDAFLKNAKDYPTLTSWRTAIPRWNKKLIFEDRQQLEIPFHKKAGAAASVHDKPNHVHVLDALEDMNVMDPDKYHSVGDFRETWENSKDEAYEMFEKDPGDNWEGEYLYDFVAKYEPWNDEDKVWNRKYVKEQEFDTETDINKVVDEVTNTMKFDKDTDIKTVFTPHGRKVWNEFVREEFFERVDQNGVYDDVEYCYDHSDKGLIDVWRAVDYVIEKGEKKMFKDIFVKITKGYRGAGVYWSWDEKSAQTYWGSSTGGKLSLTLCGRVSIEDVDWPDTIYKNGYYLKEEKEIRIKDKGNVLIYGYKLGNEKKVIELETPFVVPAGGTSFGGQTIAKK